jgi:solute:Na+ symporter, SSS family
MLAAIFGYLAVMLVIGAWVSRRIRTEGDYLVAGRRLGYPLLTFSIFATWFGAETVVGSAGQVYTDGVSLASAEPFGYGLCLILMGLVFALPLWRRRLTTLADLFRQRFGTTVERIAAVILIPASVLWAAAQVRAFGTALTVASTGSAMSLDVAITIAAMFVVAYTAFGGLLADAITDLVQGTVLIVGIVLVAVLAVDHAGGVPALGAVLAEPGRVQLAPGMGWLDLAEEWAIPVFGSVIAAELVGRIVAARSASVARTSALVAGAMYIAVGVAPVVIGLLGITIAPDLADPEQVVATLAATVLPTFAYVILLGALVSAILSTVDSTLLIASGLLSHNVLVPVLGVTDEATKLRLARGGVVAFGVLAWALALRAEGVYALVEQASAFGSAGILVCASFALFTRFGGPRAAAATLIGSLGVYVIGTAAGFAWPFLASLATALAVYTTVGMVAERRGTENGVIEGGVFERVGAERSSA